ncbi:MAG: hypothetical protein LHV69_03880 [Elusimicrobia bacterium]|nr:hypothetical protein [Candidatus Obscuribacterium magneticum]
MKLFRLFIFLSLATASVSASDNPYGIPNELDQKIKAGLHELYNYDFDQALRIFYGLRDQKEKNPMVAFGIAATHWWRLSTYVLEGDPEASKPFLEAINDCIRLARKQVNTPHPTVQGNLVLGGALGLKGRWEATNRNWLAAYFTGKDAYRYLKKALTMNPNAIDAYMGLGIFDYYVATLPTMVRVLAFIGMGGESSVGLEELSRAATEGLYSQTPSKLFLLEIYSNQENKPEKAVAIVEDLRRLYPKSPFMHMTHIICLYNAGRMEEVEKEALDLAEKVSNGTYPPECVTQSQFALGASDFKSRRWEEAIDHFKTGVQDARYNDPWKTWTYLYLGYSYDALGRRDEAKGIYITVLKQPRRWGSHDNARAALRKPFKGTDGDLKKLEL